MSDPDITIRFEIIRKVRVLTDGTNMYWRAWDGRIRWALIDWPDDGIGVRSHGAAPDLLLAIEDAEQARRIREDVTR